MALPGARQLDQARSEHDLQQRAGNLYSGRIRGAPGRRHAHYGKRGGVVYGAKPVSGNAVWEVGRNGPGAGLWLFGFERRVRDSDGERQNLKPQRTLRTAAESAETSGEQEI